MPVSRHPLMPPSPGDHTPPRVPVDPQAAQRLQATLAALERHGVALTHAFYTRLFDRYPAVRAMFPADMALQEKKLFDSLVAVVEHIKEPERVQSLLYDLGKRHVKYGATPELYPVVCTVLLEAMGEALKHEPEGWSPEINAEWAQALQIVSDLMLRGAESASTSPREATRR